MSASDRSSEATAPGGWLANQPYLLLSITALCWAGNAIVGRLAAGHIPPVTLSFLRWSLAFLIILPFAWKHLKRDWGAIRARLGTMIVLSVTGIGAFNTLQYWALEHTQALNTLLLQSAGPLFVAMWSLILLGVRLTPAQASGIALSLTGVLVILLHGDLTTLRNIEFNRGDLIFTVALAGFAPDEIAVTAEQNVLTVEGRKAEKAQREFLYQGISSRPFKRQFNLADYVQVKGAAFDNGLLQIELVREIPEAMKPRRIAINGSPASNVQQIETKAA